MMDVFMSVEIIPYQYHVYIFTTTTQIVAYISNQKLARISIAITAAGEQLPGYQLDSKYTCIIV